MYKELREVWQELTGPGAPFEVKEISVRGVTLKTYASVPPSLRELWLMTAAHGDKDHIVYLDERWTFAEAHREVASVAAWLAATGVEPGDRVAIAMRNYPEWMLAYWAIVSMGATVVGINAWWTQPELLYGLQDCEPKVLIVDQQRLEVYQAIRAEAPACKLVAVRVEGALPDGAVDWAELKGTAPALPEVSIDPDSDACIFYTSGTTGRPKGAQLTHRGCVNNVFSLAFWNLAQAAASQRAGQSKPSSKQSSARGSDPGSDPEAEATTLSALVTTPLFHVTANNCVAQTAALAGGKLVHMYKWDAGEALALIERERITNLSGVPVMSRELIAHPDFQKTDTSSLKSLGGGGAPLQPDLVAKIDDSVATARPATGYGMTETCGVITANSNDFYTAKPASVGPALPVFDAKCVDDDGRDVGLDQVGELWVKGSQVIRGYLNRPEDTDEAITDGWLHTGDIARIDEDGFIFIVDRKKDMVLRGGENVYCAEVEAAIFDLDGVLECAVFGVPDDRLGEEVAAAVVLREGSSLSGERIREHCAGVIAKYKIPRYLWLQRELLPRNASGKFLKRELRDTLDLEKAV